MIIQTKAYPRAGLIGNPSDGYYGKTISFTFDAFCAEVTLYETPELAILPGKRDHDMFESIHQLVSDVEQFGYYGGIRLLKASIKRFFEYCRQQQISLHDQNFTVRYQSNIPGQVGLAGSSAIITACMRALQQFYDVEIAPEILSRMVLEVETVELGIAAGLQDRVAQVYQGVVFMDFDKGFMEQHGHGRYHQLPKDNLKNLYIAYRRDLSEGSEIFHNDIRGRFNRRDPEVIDAMHYWAGLAQQAHDLINIGECDGIGPLLNANFDRRRSLYQLSEGNLQMVDCARQTGASAKFCGSGGAIVGTYKDEQMFEQLAAELGRHNISVLKPNIVG